MAWFEFSDGKMRNMDIWAKILLTEEEKSNNAERRQDLRMIKVYCITLQRLVESNQRTRDEKIKYESIEEREKEYNNLKRVLGAYIE